MSTCSTATDQHGLGNDFVVIDATTKPLHLTTAQARLLADRHFGIGCDRILLVQPPHSANGSFTYRIFNADGSESGQCGNGACCFMRFVRDKGWLTPLSLPWMCAAAS
ncbi:MAG TPA: hypothetical protein VK110_08785 [Salinisphaeraceae bacterium]|nr:hypothetical protein [Salinisphaeraceae bacterium]